MEITLEKIELVKDRTGVTYAEAKKALESYAQSYSLYYYSAKRRFRLGGLAPRTP